MIHITNPNVVEPLFTEESTMRLSEFDELLHPGAEGTVFHQYSLKFVMKLEKYGIGTVGKLFEANKQVCNKSSNYPRAVREIIQGHFAYYDSEIRRYRTIFDELSDEQKEAAKDHNYLVIKEEGDETEHLPDQEPTD